MGETIWIMGFVLAAVFLAFVAVFLIPKFSKLYRAGIRLQAELDKAKASGIEKSTNKQ